MMGIAKTSMMVAFWAAAANLRLLDAFNRASKRQAEAAKNGEVAKVTRQPRRHRALPLIPSARPQGHPKKRHPPPSNASGRGFFPMPRADQLGAFACPGDP